MSLVTIKRLRHALAIAVALTATLSAAHHHHELAARVRPAAPGRLQRGRTLRADHAYNTWGGYSLYQGPDGLPGDRPTGELQPPTQQWRDPADPRPEYDRLNPAIPFPRPMQVLAHSPLTCDGCSAFSDSVYYTVASGAGVLASGTMRWVCAMRGPHCGHGHPARENVAQVKPPHIAALYDGIE